MTESEALAGLRARFLEATSQIAEFWGLPRAMGAIYGAIYLAPGAVSLDELVELAQVSKGAVSTHVRSLDRLQMIHRRVAAGDRKDYYEAETDLWKVVKNVLAQRRQSDFERALATVRELAAAASALEVSRAEAPLRALYVARLTALRAFFDGLDGLVGTLLLLDDWRPRVVARTLGALGVPRRGSRGGTP